MAPLKGHSYSSELVRLYLKTKILPMPIEKIFYKFLGKNPTEQDVFLSK